MTSRIFVLSKIVISLLLIMIVTKTYAVDDYSLVIKHKNGNETYIKLSTNPIISFEGSDLFLSNDLTTLYWPLEDIDEYRLIENTSEVRDVSLDNLHYLNGHIIYSGISNDIPIYVCTIDGKIVKTFSSDDSGIADVDLGVLSKGVYILSANMKSIKVIINK